MVSVDIMIGMIGSGKSTLAKKLAEKNDAVILSSDKIRKELVDSGYLPNEYNFKTNQIVYGELRKRFEDFLKVGKNVILDGVNTIKRDQYFKITEKYDCYVTGRVLLTDKEICVQSVKDREKRDPFIHKIENPEKVASFNEREIRENFPKLEEGFDEIVIYKNNVVESVQRKTK